MLHTYSQLSTTLGGDTTIANYMGAGTTKVILSGSETLTTSTYTLTISANVTLEVASGRTLTIAGAITKTASGATITGAGNVIFSSIAAYDATSDNSDIGSTITGNRTINKYNTRF